MPNHKQERDFANLLVDDFELSVTNRALQTAIDFIADNLDPDDIFSDSQLEAWAEANGYKKGED